jgi:hypothetical protein
MRRLDDGWATNRGYEEDGTGQLSGLEAAPCALWKRRMTRDYSQPLRMWMGSIATHGDHTKHGRRRIRAISRRMERSTDCGVTSSQITEIFANAFQNSEAGV